MTSLAFPFPARLSAIGLLLATAVPPCDAQTRSDDTLKMVSQQTAEDIDRHGAGRILSATDYEGLSQQLRHPSSLMPWITDDNKWLRNHGFLIVCDNLNEFMGAITKPTPGIANLRQGASNAGQYALSVTTDWNRLAHVHGLVSHVALVGRYGTPANRMFGDWLAHSSEIYGGGGNVAVRFVMGYVEQHLLADRVAIAAGRMAQLSDFVTGSFFCDFMNNSFCGRPRAAGDSVYTTTWPVSVWAMRVRGRPVPSVYVQAGVYFTEDGLYGVTQNRSGFKLNAANIVGQVFPVEAGWQPRLGAHGGLTGHYKIGVSVENVRRARPYAILSRDELSDGSLATVGRRGAWSAWLLADQRLCNLNARDKNSGISLMVGLLLNDPTISLRQQQAYGGLVARGFWQSRPTDTIGIAGSWTKIATNVQRTEERLLATSSALPYQATGIQRSAVVLEGYYAFRIGRAVVLQPDFQYYIRPNGQANLRNAALLGFRSHVEIF